MSQSDLPHTLKLMTVWLCIGLALFLGFKYWEREREASRFKLAGEVIVLTRGGDGHFHWPGKVDGIEVDFLVDTGATVTALPQALAERAGLKPLGAVQAHTAAGATRGFAARAASRWKAACGPTGWPSPCCPTWARPCWAWTCSAACISARSLANSASSPNDPPRPSPGLGHRQRPRRLPAPARPADG